MNFTPLNLWQLNLYINNNSIIVMTMLAIVVSRKQKSPPSIVQSLIKQLPIWIIVSISFATITDHFWIAAGLTFISYSYVFFINGKIPD